MRRLDNKPRRYLRLEAAAVEYSLCPHIFIAQAYGLSVRSQSMDI
jgi:hypothetical protein